MASSIGGDELLYFIGTGSSVDCPNHHDGDVHLERQRKRQLVVAAHPQQHENSEHHRPDKHRSALAAKRTRPPMITFQPSFPQYRMTLLQGAPFRIQSRRRQKAGSVLWSPGVPPSASPSVTARDPFCPSPRTISKFRPVALDDIDVRLVAAPLDDIRRDDKQVFPPFHEESNLDVRSWKYVKPVEADDDRVQSRPRFPD